MQLTLAAVVLCACVAITVQGPLMGGPPGPPERSPGYPGGQDPPRKWDYPDMSRDSGKWGAGDGDMKPSGKEGGDKWMPGQWDGKWKGDDKWGKESMQKPGGAMQKMGGSKPSPPAGIHMKFEFDVAPAAMGGQERDMEQKDNSWGDNMGGKGGSWGDKGGNWGDSMGDKGGNWGDDMGGKGGSWGGKGGNWGDKMGGKGGKGGNWGDKMGGKGGNKGMDMKKRPHRPIICRVNASGSIVARDCPFNLTCGGGKGIKQGNWTTYFCHADPAKRDVTEFDYPDQSEFFHLLSDEMKKEIMGGDDMDDSDVVGGMDGGNGNDNGGMGGK